MDLDKIIRVVLSADKELTKSHRRLTYNSDEANDRGFVVWSARGASSPLSLITLP